MVCIYLFKLMFPSGKYLEVKLVDHIAVIFLSLWGTSISSVQCSWLVMSESVTPWTATCQASLSITNSQSLLKLVSIKLVMPSSHVILCHPLLLPSIFPSIRVFSNESVLHIRWPKYWSFSISPSSEYSGLISMIPPSHLILCHPLRLLPSIFPSIRVFSNESALHIRWPNIGASVWGSVFPWKFRVDFL